MVCPLIPTERSLSSLTSISVLPGAQNCESHFSSIDTIRVEDKPTDFFYFQGLSCGGDCAIDGT